MAGGLHRFEYRGERFAIDPESCFCFHCDGPAWDVVAHYPHETADRIAHLLEGEHGRDTIEEVVSELDWLRGTKSICQPVRPQQFQQRLTHAPDIERAIVLEGAGDAWRKALWLVLGRSGKTCALDWRVHSLDAVAIDELAVAWEEARNAAVLAGKSMTLGLVIPARIDRPGWRGSSEGEEVPACYFARLLPDDDIQVGLRSVSHLGRDSVRQTKWKACTPLRVALVFAPANHWPIHAMAAAFESEADGIAIDLQAAFASGNAIDPIAFYRDATALLEAYAAHLAKGGQQRVEPFLAILHRLYEGKPVFRGEQPGGESVAVGADDQIYAGASLASNPFLPISASDAAALDAAREGGSPFTAACYACWARHLCGGGTPGLHYSLTGDPRQPHPRWCDARRAFFEAAVAALHRVTAAGRSLPARDGSPRSGADAARVTGLLQALWSDPGLRLRGIEEADASMLARWESWSESAYFAFHEGGALIATEYDREMDALYPRGFEQESLLTAKDGTPLGLLRMRPEPAWGSLQIAVFLLRPEEWARPSRQRAFAKLIELALQNRRDIHLRIAVGPIDAVLESLLRGSGFVLAGTQREALFLHGHRHDVTWYAR